MPLPIDDDDEENTGVLTGHNVDDLDPRVQDYLKKQMGNVSRTQDPDYRKSLRDDIGDARAMKGNNDFAALLADSASLMGTVAGKRADASGMANFAKSQNKNIDESMADLHGQEPKFDDRVLTYLAQKNNAAQRAQSRTDALSQKNDALKQQRDEFDLKRADYKDQANTRHGELGVKRDELNAKLKDRSDQKVSDTQNKNFIDLHKEAEGEGRASPDLRQSLVNRLNIKNAKGLLDRNPDLNAMPQGDVALFTAELGKIAAGGVASDSARHELQPQSFKSDWDMFMSKVEGKPTGAELGEFLKDKKAYLEDLERVSNDTIAKHQRRAYDARVGNMISDEHRNAYKNAYPEAFPENQDGGDSKQPAMAPAPKGGFGEAVGAAPTTAPRLGEERPDKNGVMRVRTARGWEVK